MRAVDQEVLGQLQQWLKAGKRSWLATVVATWGSSPRPAGSLLACNVDGQKTGSLSGSCVEDDLLEQLLAGNLAVNEPMLFEYGVTAEETERLGLPCGGQLSVFLEPLDPAKDASVVGQIDSVVSALSKRHWLRRTVTVESGNSHTQITPVERFQPLQWQSQPAQLAQTFGPQQQLFVIGAGMVSQYLADMALMLDFDVTVCDPREHLINDFPNQSIRLVCDMPDDAVARYASDASSAIVALTHDPRIDDMGLMQALTTDAFYVGAMGSSRTSAARRERLLALDLSAAEIDRLHAPIGLPIGSKTPPEIAVAILAEIIAVRKGANAQSTSTRLQAATNP